MFFGGPEDSMPMLSEADVDRGRRCVPSPDQQTKARLAMIGHKWIKMCLVPIVFPGKVRGVWTVGQPVEHPEGIAFASDLNGSFTKARVEVEQLAADALGDRDGTIGYILLERGHYPAVFEGFVPRSNA